MPASIPIVSMGDQAPSAPAPAKGVTTHLFFLFALPWLAVLYFASRAAPALPLPALLALLVLVALPIAAAGIYLSTVRQIRRLTAFSRAGLLATLLSGRALRSAFWVFWSIVASFLLLVELGSYKPAEWLALAALVPMFWLVFSLSSSFARAEARPYLSTRFAIVATCLITPLLMIPLYVLVRQHLAGEPPWPTLGDAVAASRANLPEAPATPLIGELSQWVSYQAALKSFIVSRLASLEESASPFLFALTQWVVFVNGSIMLSCFVIPPNEFRRIFAQALDSDLPPPPSRARTLSILSVALISTTLTLTLFIRADRWAADDPRPAGWRSWLESQIAISVEEIDGRWFEKGTLATIRELQLQMASELEPLRKELIAEIDSSFDLAASKTDVFLDWYYSLGGEYGRIVKMAAGDLESHMAEKLSEKLELDSVFAGFEEKLGKLSKLQGEAQAHFEREREKILAANRIDQDESQKIIVVAQAPPELLELPQPIWLTNLETRLGLSVVTGLAAGAVSGTVSSIIVQRLLGGQAFKLAVQTVVRVVATKAGGRLVGAGAGAVAGGAAGSVVPGVGTVVGGIVGAAVGLATAVGVDKIMLEIEQAVNREAFRAEIISSLDEARSELKSHLLPPPEPTYP
jgi:hypothetical protein